MDYLFDMTPEGSPGQEEAMAAIERIRGLLRDTWFAGMDEWKEQVTKRAKDQLTNRSRACCLNDFAVEAAKQRLVGIDGIDLCAALGFFKIYLDDKYVLRLKRLNRNRLARNVKTDQQRAYYRNRPVEGIRNYCTRLTAGYMLTPAEDEIEDILITSQFGTRTLVWSSSIMDDPGTMRMPIPLEPDGPTPPSIVVRKKNDQAQGG
jgi:hypothetical protein